MAVCYSHIKPESWFPSRHLFPAYHISNIQQISCYFQQVQITLNPYSTLQLPLEPSRPSASAHKEGGKEGSKGANRTSSNSLLDL